MEINLRYYVAVIPSIKSIIKNNKNKSHIELIAISSEATGAHVVVCGYYVASIVGMTKEIQDHIDFLIKFYQISNILYVNEFIKEKDLLNE